MSQAMSIIPPFERQDVVAAIKRSKYSTATGPDGLCILHHKHMGDKALDYLTTLFNLSLAKAEMPAIWKRSIVLPVLKPGKPATEGPSYRPISLLCPASKLLERLILPHFHRDFRLNETQHGFRSDRSTTTALLPIVNDVAAGFNQRKPPMRTVLVLSTRSITTNCCRRFSPLHSMPTSSVGSPRTSREESSPLSSMASSPDTKGSIGGFLKGPCYHQPYSTSTSPTSRKSDPNTRPSLTTPISTLRRWTSPRPRQLCPSTWSMSAAGLRKLS